MICSRGPPQCATPPSFTASPPQYDKYLVLLCANPTFLPCARAHASPGAPPLTHATGPASRLLAACRSIEQRHMPLPSMSEYTRRLKGLQCGTGGGRRLPCGSAAAMRPRVARPPCRPSPLPRRPDRPPPMPPSNRSTHMPPSNRSTAALTLPPVATSAR
eukprot:1356386-Prymnesium_polylepis.2